MPLIRMLTLSAGPAGVLHIGSEYELPEQQAAELVAGGYAVEVNPAPAVPQVETTQRVIATEKAVKTTAPRK